MKYRYLILDLCAGCYKGTNDYEKALEFASCDDFFVADAEKGEMMAPDSCADPITSLDEEKPQSED